MFDLSQDQISGGTPREGFGWALCWARWELLLFLQLWDAAQGAAPQMPRGQPGEEALHLAKKQEELLMGVLAMRPPDDFTRGHIQGCKE